MRACWCDNWVLLAWQFARAVLRKAGCNCIPGQQPHAGVEAMARHRGGSCGGWTLASPAGRPRAGCRGGGPRVAMSNRARDRPVRACQCMLVRTRARREGGAVHKGGQFVRGAAHEGDVGL